jgi:hypothetical protein
MTAELTPELSLEHLYIDDTGLFRWKTHRGSSSVGHLAGTKRAHGQVLIGFGGRHFTPQRSKYFIEYGRWPKYHARGRTARKDTSEDHCIFASIRVSDYDVDADDQFPRAA